MYMRACLYNSQPFFTLNKNNMGQIVKYNEDEVKNAIILSRGILNRVGKMLKISHTTVYSYVDRYELRAFVDNVRLELEDLALEVVADNMVDDPKLALGLLQHLQRSKNAQNNLQINVADGGGIQIVVPNQKDADDLDEFINS